MNPSDDTPAILSIARTKTMESNIAQLGCVAEMQTLLHDPNPDALKRKMTQILNRLEHEMNKEQMAAETAERAQAQLHAAPALEDLTPYEIVIETAPERIELKHQLFDRLSEIVSTDYVLTNNTSSLLVTALAPAATHPERVINMHFFNPPPVIALLEMMASAESSDRALAVAHTYNKAMDKQMIDTANKPNFLVNHCNRP